MADQSQNTNEGSELVPIEIKTSFEQGEEAVVQAARERSVGSEITPPNKTSEKQSEERYVAPEVPLTGVPVQPKSAEQPAASTEFQLAEGTETQPVEPRPATEPATAEPAGQLVAEGPYVAPDPKALQQIERERELAFESVTGIRKKQESKPDINTIRTLRSIGTVGNAVPASPGLDIKGPKLVQDLFLGKLTDNVNRLESATAEKEEKMAETAGLPKAA